MNDINNTDPEAWTPEKIAQVGETLRPKLLRFRKSRGDLAAADVKAEAEKKAKRAKKGPNNLDLDKKP
jgi:hypothetical protein